MNFETLSETEFATLTEAQFSVLAESAAEVCLLFHCRIIGETASGEEYATECDPYTLTIAGVHA